MPAKKKFKETLLSQSMSMLIPAHTGSRLCMSMFFMMFTQHSMAQTPQTETPVALTQAEMIEGLSQQAVQQGLASTENEATEKIEQAIQPEVNVDSLQMLREQEQAGQQFEAFKPIEFEDLEELPIQAVDQAMADEIYRVAEEAKREAQAYRQTQNTEIVVNDVSQQELLEINQAPVNVDQLMQNIESDSQILVQANETGATLPELSPQQLRPENATQPNIFKRLFYKVRPPRRIMTAKVPRIDADVVIVKTNGNGTSQQLSAEARDEAYKNLEANIENKLSSFTQESFSDFQSALPQLRTLSNQAAQAVGFYNASFRFEKLSDSRVRVYVTPNEPVLVQSQNIEFSGAGANTPQFQVIGVLPELEEGDVFHHGKYERTKERIVEAASNNGYFDAYWRSHDAKVAQPQNTADINLRYETGNAYKLGAVTFRMSDPTKEFPLDPDVLQSLVPWQEGADYRFWRVNSLANNLTNTRYFNYTLVDAVKPDPIEQPLELPPDIQQLVDEQLISESSLAVQDKKQVASNEEVTQDVVDESQFAGSQEQDQANLRALRTAQEAKEAEQERLKAQAREEKVIPVLVTLNADTLNSAELGLGYGTDTGMRVRGQYRRAIVNKRGHSFDANVELSEIRQSIDGRYNIPYKHPLNDYFSIVGGYEREERDDVARGNGLLIESAVVGADRFIKNPRGSWQHTYGVRYRLDQLTQQGEVNANNIPDAFLVSAAETQESLLFGYELSRTVSDKRVNPTKGFKQTYKLEVGSEALLSDADMAIANAGWRFIYSLGENADHQFVGRADAGYIFTEDFTKVPYNLRYFTGGDQSIRGFDYKSLSPEINGYKVGGQAQAIGSLEYNYQFKEGWRAAVFADAGNAYDKDFSNPTEYGVGLGVRWASPIGPIRIDVASGISEDNHPIRLHFFIGSQL
ncbi:autotransporter assembly complex family protein [Acinetobacter thermotolerans]|uniref:autotransporter assembly complex protein TamA n=1 Tax=Acinetobacter thermotolerans TaxID=3151487 RepID=UPI00325AF03A